MEEKRQNRFFDEEEIRKTIDVLKPDGQLFECRIIEGKKNYSGYFTSCDVLLRELKKIGLAKTNVYITLNEIHDACYSRKQRNTFILNASPTTGDNDITYYRWLLIDLDPNRPSGTSSSDKELDCSIEKAERIKEYLTSKGFSEPVQAISGNGYHLLYKVCFPANSENKDIVKAFFEKLSELYSDDAVNVDTSVFNPARICKLHGTLAQKGTSTEDRPHRLSYIYDMPYGTVVSNDIQLLKDVIGTETTTNQKTNTRPGTTYQQNRKKTRSSKAISDIDSWLNEHGIGYRETGTGRDNSRILTLDCCAFDATHTDRCAKIFAYPNGAFSYKCHHNSCSDKRWREFRLFYEPDAYDNCESYFDEVIYAVDQETGEVNKDQFLYRNPSNGRIGILDYSIFEYITQMNNIKAVGKELYLYKDGCYRTSYGDAQVKQLIIDCLKREFIKSDTVNRIHRLFFQSADVAVNFDDMNRQPKHWVNFQNGFYDPITREIHPHDPALLCTNQIPHSYDPSQAVTYSQRIEDYLHFIVPKLDDREMLLQYLGYCFTGDTRFQKFMLITGPGGNGKGVMLRLLDAMIGADNTSNASLKDMQNRFNAKTMQGKILNSCGDIETDALEDIAFLKKLTGEDTLRVEPKGVDAYSIHICAKLIFSANEVPELLGEKSDAFWRRVLVLPMMNKPTKVNPNLTDELIEDLDYLIFLCMESLHDAYLQGSITESENHCAAKLQALHDSDSIQAFIDNACTVEGQDDYPKGYYGDKGFEMFKRYLLYCDYTDRIPCRLKGFYKALRTKGFEITHQHNSVYVRGIADNNDPYPA